MDKNMKLSLKKEIEKQAQKIEEEIMNAPDIEDLESFSRMESDLLKKIKEHKSKTK